MFKRVPGIKDILPLESCQWQKIEEISRKIFSLYNYQEIRTPVIEEANLFNRCLGEFTEVLQKQMFLINNKDGAYALRPEGTASVVRAYIENDLYKTDNFVKFYYIGPMFRRERPQKGRLRQFHHIGCEVIGSSSPQVDMEVIALADGLLGAYSVIGYEININNLGCAKDKLELAHLLRKGLNSRQDKLCADCRIRFKKNILRIIDCKNKDCQEIIKGLEIKDSHICPECKIHFNRVKEGLDELGIKYRINPYIVRGLDYYTRTVFEIRHKDLGAQDALGAGGRYDNLVHDLGGPDIGAMGFAFGVERLLLVSKCQSVKVSKLVYVITLGDKAKREGFKLLALLRKQGIPADTDYEAKSLKGAMRSANDLGSRYVVIIGEDELNKGAVTLKDMSSGEQREVKIENIVSQLIVSLRGAEGDKAIL